MNWLTWDGMGPYGATDLFVPNTSSKPKSGVGLLNRKIQDKEKEPF